MGGVVQLLLQFTNVFSHCWRSRTTTVTAVWLTVFKGLVTRRNSWHRGSICTQRLYIPNRSDHFLHHTWLISFHKTTIT